MIYQKFPNSELKDGIKFYPTNYSWVLIRPSNTEKIIRISVEAKSKSLETVKSEIHEVLYNEAVDNRFQKWLEDLRKRSHIKVIK